MTEEEEFNAIKDVMLSDGGKLILGDIERNLESSDTIKVMPLIDKGVVICSQTDQMLKQQGYVAALEWVTGTLKHYRDNHYEETE